MDGKRLTIKSPRSNSIFVHFLSVTIAASFVSSDHLNFFSLFIFMTYDADVSFAKYQAIMDMHNIPKAHIVFLGEGGRGPLSPLS